MCAVLAVCCNSPEAILAKSQGAISCSPASTNCDSPCLPLGYCGDVAEGVVGILRVRALLHLDPSGFADEVLEAPTDTGRVQLENLAQLVEVRVLERAHIQAALLGDIEEDTLAYGGELLQPELLLHLGVIRLPHDFEDDVALVSRADAGLLVFAKGPDDEGHVLLGRELEATGVALALEGTAGERLGVEGAGGRKGAEQRQEFVAEIAGVHDLNDSLELMESGLNVPGQLARRARCSCGDLLVCLLSSLLSGDLLLPRLNDWSERGRNVVGERKVACFQLVAGLDGAP